ncbi:MAG: hypothetical protein GAK31_01666 [Stenotrophomonas maltophilia]|uniref:Uncharacterized protein n=1 Tax=Stenotrophomonas maltophilia TaxID=40324 RepID=A0A7V8FI44_STEMA|nr:MAG: hypothetical protein GAK31_01666 [Stenotrophomonas maltophilia]
MNDLSNIVATERRLAILHPATEEPVGLVLLLRPDSDPVVKAASRKAINDRMGARGKVTAEQLEASRLNMLCASISGWQWNGDASFHGEKPAFEELVLRQLLKELPWLAEQADSALTDRAAFFQRADGEGG